MSSTVPLSDFAVVVNPKPVGALRADNIAVARDDIPAGQCLLLDETVIAVEEAVPRGANLAIRAIPQGESLIALGVHVGFAAQDIPAGQVLDPGPRGNVIHELDSPEPGYCSRAGPTQYREDLLKRTFNGFRRKVTQADKEGAGTQNVVALINTAS